LIASSNDQISNDQRYNDLEATNKTQAATIEDQAKTITSLQETVAELKVKQHIDENAWAISSVLSLLQLVRLLRVLPARTHFCSIRGATLAAPFPASTASGEMTLVVPRSLCQWHVHRRSN
jgi:hypothetical protein